MAARNINKEEFNQLLKGEKPVLVDFWAPWCSYCRRINPAYDRVAAQFEESVEVVKINIDDEGQLANLEQIEVIPTLVLYKGGKAVDSIVAPESKALIDELILKNL
jgi:thioredoxin 1